LKGTAGRERVPGGRLVRETPAGRERPPAYRCKGQLSPHQLLCSIAEAFEHKWPYQLNINRLYLFQMIGEYRLQEWGLPFSLWKQG